MITTEELKKLQKLAKLNFTETEIISFTSKLQNVMEMIDTLQGFDCGDTEPLRSVCDMEQRQREDEVKTDDISEEIFANIPENGSQLAHEVKCFVVPKVVE